MREKLGLMGSLAGLVIGAGVELTLGGCSVSDDGHTITTKSISGEEVILARRTHGIGAGEHVYEISIRNGSEPTAEVNDCFGSRMRKHRFTIRGSNLVRERWDESGFAYNGLFLLGYSFPGNPTETTEESIGRGVYHPECMRFIGGNPISISDGRFVLDEGEK